MPRGLTRKIGKIRNFGKFRKTEARFIITVTYNTYILFWLWLIWFVVCRGDEGAVCKEVCEDEEVRAAGIRGEGDGI